MSQKGIEQLIGKALADQKFLQDFLKDPEGKVKAEGLDISAQELAQVKRVDPEKAKKFSEIFAKEFVSRKQTGM